MKFADKTAHMAALATFIDFFSVEDLAEGSSAYLATANGNRVEVEKVRSNGFTLRRKGDNPLSEESLHEALANTVREYLHGSDESREYLLDIYDLEWDVVDNAFHTFAKDVFEINRSGRLIYIEFDV